MARESREEKNDEVEVVETVGCGGKDLNLRPLGYEAE